MGDDKATKPNLKIIIEYGKMSATIEGQYNEVWKGVNEFLAKVKQALVTSDSPIAIAGKNVKEILIQLRDTSFFDKPRTTSESDQRIRELGKTDITRNAVSMALKELTENGQMKRIKQNNEYVYAAPWASN